jgi:hypothetical protein
MILFFNPLGDWPRGVFVFGMGCACKGDCRAGGHFTHNPEEGSHEQERNNICRDGRDAVDGGMRG